MERVNRAQLEARLENLNRRLDKFLSLYRYELAHQGGVGYYLNRTTTDGHVIRNIAFGTKGQLGEVISNMCQALDDANIKEPQNAL